MVKILQKTACFLALAVLVGVIPSWAGPPAPAKPIAAAVPETPDDFFETYMAKMRDKFAQSAEQTSMPFLYFAPRVQAGLIQFMIEHCQNSGIAISRQDAALRHSPC